MPVMQTVITKAIPEYKRIVTDRIFVKIPGGSNSISIWTVLYLYGLLAAIMLITQDRTNMFKLWVGAICIYLCASNLYWDFRGFFDPAVKKHGDIEHKLSEERANAKEKGVNV